MGCKLSHVLAVTNEKITVFKAKKKMFFLDEMHNLYAM